MSLPAKMAHSPAFHVLVGVCMPSVIWCTHKTTELQTCPFEGEPKADVQRDVRVVCVHVKPQILSLAVPHNEAMVTIPYTARTREEQFAKGLKHLLQRINEWFQAYLIEDDAIVVHAIRSSCFQATGIEVEDLLQKYVAKGLSEDREGEDLPFELFRQEAPPSTLASIAVRLPEGWFQPLFLPAHRVLEERWMHHHVSVLADDCEARYAHLLVSPHRVEHPKRRLLRIYAPLRKTIDQKGMHRLHNVLDSVGTTLIGREVAVERIHHRLPIVRQRVVKNAAELHQCWHIRPRLLEAKPDPKVVTIRLIAFLSSNAQN
mmetsp:Transcript_22628/g.52783  ORF Transcript_22628/g.52783 Transcript_22628/m.52783 type:complete len:317 (+) Transcript_22628:356-1306(+)